MEPFMEEDKTEKLKLFYIDSWQNKYPQLRAGLSSRLGGTSKAPYHSLNLGLHVGDFNGNVINNREQLADAVGIPIESWVYAEQVHGNEVTVVRGLDKGKGIRSRESAIQAMDGFITQEKDICIAALFADCVPLYFYDPQHQAIGLAHAGWKGTVQEIAAATIAKMNEHFGSLPNEIIAAIGPSIGLCCFEVDEVVMNKVWELYDRGQVDKEGDNPLFQLRGNGKYMLNLQELNRQIMIKAGILPSHIEVSDYCTSCRTDLFYSHRKEMGKTGRMVAWIGLG